ncbi:MAG: pyridoxal 5'-phosphate synthase glutaminase subunit PdxT [Schwartzia sp.]|nr:pyridoxal 5'-phosphate synthase glutaminase subunit PdxT [Schwartzia sp. (in: firmicutes)]
MAIGIVAVQGAFLEHEKILDRLGIEYAELRQKSDLDREYDGLILPGGESTVQGKLLKELDMFDTLRGWIAADMPVLATCAGMILLAEKLSNDDKEYFRSIPMTVRRNAYGRQVGSFHTAAAFGDKGVIPMTFIRAPFVESAAPEAEILSVVDGNIVGVRYKNQIALAFHPELDDDLTVHQAFIGMI